MQTKQNSNDCQNLSTLLYLLFVYLREGRCKKYTFKQLFSW